MSGLGKTLLHGLSPAMDLFDSEHESLEEVFDVSIKQQNLLLIGSTDARHIFKTASRRSASHNLNFYIIEPQPTLICRQLLLLQILVDSSLSSAESSTLFLDVFGNKNISQKSFEYVQSTCGDLIKLVADQSGPLSHITDFSGMRYRERDDIAFAFNFWRGDAKFMLDEMWEARLRTFYASRYDSRQNLVDWDYHMNLKDKASIVHIKEFLQWRIEGNAFHTGNCANTFTNRTFATVSGLLQDGVMVPKWGFFSDIVCGPFYAHGIEAENQQLFQKSNDVHTSSSQQVTESNIDSYIKGLQDAKFNLKFLPCDPNQTLVKYKHRYISKFHCIYLANHVAQYLPNCRDLLKEGGKVIVETARFVLELTTEQSKTYQEKLEQMAKTAGLHLVKAEENSLIFQIE